MLSKAFSKNLSTLSNLTYQNMASFSVVHTKVNIFDIMKSYRSQLLVVDLLDSQ
jgi:hypothetical protein